ncbi:MAG: ribosomal L7Ae/L30e/S12e/Gadd45 family protein [Lachnospiraceae bacterium]|nr:ribosomal L7Ae/L30e/S12e/Gadd45 family protein [Lachnospiraceae bacterium]
MKQNKIYALLSLAARGRNVVSGEFSTENAVKNGSAVLVIVAEDASDNTKKLFRDKCAFYNVPVYTYGTKEELGHAMGKGERTSVALINEGLAHTVTKHLEELQN